jgi:proteasome lid subunit RPN8/RPN11
MRAETNLSENLLNQMEEHAFTSPGEVCGFVYKKHYVPLRNLSAKVDHFYADPSALAHVLSQQGEPFAIFHTHPNGSLELSAEDRAMWYYSNSTMIVGCIKKGRLRWKMYGKPGD